MVLLAGVVLAAALIPEHVEAQAKLPALPQSTVTGHLPACVEEPTFQRHVILVPVFRPSPSACETVVS